MHVFNFIEGTLRFRNGVPGIPLSGFSSIFPSFIAVTRGLFLFACPIHGFLLNLSVIRVNYWVFILPKTSNFFTVSCLIATRRKFFRWPGGQVRL